MMNSSRELLEKKNVDQLLEVAKGYNIVGRSRLKKTELIDKIIEVEKEINKKKYLDKVGTGTIIAFTLPTGKALSGMVIQIYTDQYEVETKNGRRFRIPHINVIWVKTNGRWPKSVYMALKGGIANGSTTNTDVIEGSKAANC